MKVLYLHCVADLYGASRCLLRLVERLQAEGHETVTVLPYDGVLHDALLSVGGDVVLDEAMPILRRSCFKSIRGMTQLVCQYIRGVSRFERLIFDHHVDVVHTNSAITLAGGAAAHRCGVPHITHIRESFGEFGILWHPYKRHILANSDRVICVSRAMTEQFGDSVPAQHKVTHVYDGFSPDDFNRVTDADVQLMRHRYELDAEGLRIVGLVGRIKWKRKGQETFVRAASQLVRDDPSLRFVMVGGAFPGNESHIEMTLKLIEELGVKDQVLYLGETHDIYPVMRMFDVAVMASGLPEPFGGVTIEAMALGLPVVGTSIGGTPEQIEDGVTGLLVPPNEPEAMAYAIRSLLNDPAHSRAMGSAGRERFIRCFSFEPHYMQMLSEYERMIVNMQE